MKCNLCNPTALEAAVFWFGQTRPDGTQVHMEVSGFECSKCGTRWLKGLDAERISRAWYRIEQDSTDWVATA